MASIEKRGKGYRIVVSNGYNLDGTKRSEKLTIKPEEVEGLSGKKLEAELNRRAVLFEELVKKGLYLDGEKTTFGEFAERWLSEYAEVTLEDTTLQVYEFRLRKRIIPEIGHLTMSKVQPVHLVKLYKRLAQGDARLDILYFPTKQTVKLLTDKDKKGLAAQIGIDRSTYRKLKEGNPTNYKTSVKIADFFDLNHKKAFTPKTLKEKLSDQTILHHHRLISSVFTTAVQWQVVVSNPAKRLKPPSVKKKKAKYYEDEQVLALFTALEEVPLKYKTMIYLTFYTGIRLSEVAGLDWEDFDPKGRTITINKQRLYTSKRGVYETDPKTDAGSRICAIPQVDADLLNEYKLECKKLRLQHGDKWAGAEPGTGYIFLGMNGKPMFPTHPSVWFHKFLKKNDLPELVFHGLRHSNASLMIAEGIDIVTVSERLGHANKFVTLNIYSHAIRSNDRSAVDALQERLAKKKEDLAE